MAQKQLLVILSIFVIIHAKSIDEKEDLQVDVTRATRCHESRQARVGDKVTVHYGGFLKDGKKFDSSFDRAQPFTFTLGVGQVIPGWDKGLLSVCKGDERHLVVPSHMAYGDRGAGNVIPPGATLLFDIVIVDVERVENEVDLKKKEEEKLRKRKEEEEEKRKLEEKLRKEEEKLKKAEEKKREEELRRKEEELRRKQQKEEEERRRAAAEERRKKEEEEAKRQEERRRAEEQRAKAQEQRTRLQEGTRRKQEEKEYEYYEDYYYEDYPSACGIGELDVKVTYQPGRCLKTAKTGDKLTMHYVGKLKSGTQFDSSVDRNKPFEFTLGVGQVIAGWDAGLEGMCVGETRSLTIPPDQAYGEAGVGSVIPPCSTLVFDVELLDIQ